MVFESVVTDVLNRFLGDYIENLDSKQLKLGIWGGDIVLTNLHLKQNALKDLDLPIQTIYGRLDKLVVKIPWSNLYGAAVEATIEGLYLLLAPNNQVEYNAEKEEQREYDTKLAELQKIDDRKKLEEVKANTDDTFVEKLVTQIIKNVQLKIKDIHIRYEDRSLSAPFAMGATLSNLIVQTTNEDWQPTILQDVVQKIYKIVSLEGLAVYWNCDTEMFSELPEDRRREVFIRDIANKQSKPENYKYILGPINSEARLVLNPKPEHNSPPFESPKAHAELKIDTLSVGISMGQYRDIITFADSMQLQIVGLPYRKYRPQLQYSGHAKEWWTFALTCILETQIKRKKRNWNWDHMCAHRETCKKYGELYKTKLTTKKLPKDTEEELKYCEKSLDLYNLVLIRQRISMEVEMLDKMRKEKQPKGWFSGWFGGSKAAEDDEDTKNYLKRFQEAMTPEEKQKLFAAIDYNESDAPTLYPDIYVDTVVKFELKEFKLNIRNDVSKLTSVVKLKLSDVKSSIARRPKQNGLKVQGFIGNLMVTGVPQNDLIPELITSNLNQKGEQANLVEVMFEMNPLDMLNGNRVHVTANPLQVTYDFVTIQEIIKVFHVPSSSALEELSRATAQQLNEVKEKSALGLQSVIEKHTKLDIHVNLSAPIVIIPHGGLYTGGENVLVVNLGTLLIKSVINTDIKAVTDLIKSGFAKTKVMDEMILQSYDRFQVDLTGLQVLVAQSDEKWLEQLLLAKTTPMHLLCPINLSILLETCIIQDPSMPMNKISGEVPDIFLKITDARLILALGLIDSLSKQFTTEASELTRSVSTSSLRMIGDKTGTVAKKAIAHQIAQQPEKVQMTVARVMFELQKFRFSFSHQETIADEAIQVMNVALNSLTLKFTEKTSLRKVELGLQSIEMNQWISDTSLPIINTSLDADNKKLFKVNFTQLQREHPEFETKYKKTLIILGVDFYTLELNLHHAALIDLMKYANEIQMVFEEDSEPRLQRARRGSTSSIGSVRLVKDAMKTAIDSSRSKTNALSEEINFQLNANLEQIAVSFHGEIPLSKILIAGLHSDIILTNHSTNVQCYLNYINVIDLNPKTLYPKIIDVDQMEKAIDVTIILHNNASYNEPDIVIQATLGKIRASFVFWYVSNMLNFLNSFAVAREAIVAASQKAAQVAKENIENIYEKATKIKLDIRLNAPEIVIPEKSTSLDALFVDLGLITITNEFNFLETKNEKGHNAVLDEMQLKLVQLGIDSISFSKTFAIVNRVPILQPLNFTLQLNRNLSLWYTAIPDVDVNGVIDHIHVQMGQNDYSTLMKILNENMTEGKVDVYTPTHAEMKDVALTTGASLVSTDPSEETRLLQDDNEDAFIKTSFRWNFAMHSFKVNLYNVQSTGYDTGKVRVGLGELLMEGFLVKGRMLSNNSITNNLLLMNLLLSDTRPNREGKITEIFCRTSAVLEKNARANLPTESILVESRNMIDMTLQTKKSDTFIDLRVYSFTFLVSVEYLLKLSSFFQEVVDNEEGMKPTAKKSAVSTDRRKAEKASETNSLISIAVKLEKPDVILVENVDDLNTRALILNCELLMKLRITGEKQTVNGTLSDFQMYTCMFDPTIRESTKNMFLEPFTLSIAGSTPEGKGLHVEAYMTTIYIGVSVYTIELLNNVLKTISTSADTMGAVLEEMIDMSNLWNMRENRQFWFLQTEEAEDVLTTKLAQPTNKQKVLNEMCLVNVPQIIITLQAGVGHKTYPILALESKFSGKVTNWSSQLFVEATLSLQMGYYNNLLALWEPIIEPVTIESEDQLEPRTMPWEIRLEVNMNEKEDKDEDADETGEDGTILSKDLVPQPAMTIDISSTNNLELTVTKTALEVFASTAKMFSAATTASSDELKKKEVAGLYKVVNSIGTDVVLNLNLDELVHKGNMVAMTIKLEQNSEVYLDPVNQKLKGPSDQIESFCSYGAKLKEKYISVEIPEFNANLTVPYLAAVSRYYRLPEVKSAKFSKADKSASWGIVSTVNVVNGITVITLSSVVEVHNCFNVPVDIYYMRESGNELELIETIQPNTTLHVPLNAVYSATSELFFSVEGYSITTTPFVWKDLKSNVIVNKSLVCSSKTEAGKSFVIKVIGELNQIYFENTTRHTMSSSKYTINLRPAVIFRNCLPYDIQLSVGEPNGVIIAPGNSLELPNVDPGQTDVVIKLPKYLDKTWACKREIALVPPQFSVWTLDSHDSIAKMSLDLGMHCLNQDGSYIMSLYCPFWMINKTGLILSYRTTDENTNVLFHPAYHKDPILFSFNAKNFFGKKKACVKVNQGDWCEKFSIDVAGSSGVIMCTESGKHYQIGVQNELTYNGLTKMITFTPYFVIINQSNFAIECQEDKRPADPWLEAAAKSCIAFWPVSEADDKLLRVRMQGTDEISIPFLITESHTTLVKLKNKFGGINVDIQLTEGAVYINLTLYDKGMAPALIINSTKHTMNLWEKKSVHIHKLLPDHNMVFTWDYPSSDRVLVWEAGYKEEVENELRMDGVGSYEIAPNENVFWVSFLDGMQRVLLFTSDENVADNAQSTKQFEIIDREITLSLHGLGLSVVNNLLRQEIVYIAIASTGIIWETSKNQGKRYKQMNTALNMATEKEYQQYMLKSGAGTSSSSIVAYEPHMEVDFEAMEQLKPRRRRIRRRFQTGIWLQMKTSEHQMQLHAKINRLQIDNQLHDCTFPVLLAPVPPPKSVVVTDANKPFAEVSIVQLLMKNSQIQQYKYFKVLVQEFHVKVDLGFINSIMEVLDTSAKSEEEEKEHFLADIQRVTDALYSHATQISIQEQKSFYDLLHFSPLKIHVSFSMTQGGQSSGMGNIPLFLGVLLQGIGVTLTDMQDVVFKLAYFEREYSFLTQKQLVSEATKHYVGQTVKQLYVLVLGLDVIGNPYGLVLGITKGVEDLFYEPFQGAIQGPGEFAEGLAFGVASLFGHTFGGAAGAVSRITGAMGKGIAALSFDKEFQRKRRDQINKRPATVKEGFARGGKGLVMGVFDGVTGVFTKPISGAKEQGIGGFFKGLGKGAVGLVARPTAGVMDFASSSLESVKRVTEFNAAYVTRLRAPRFIQIDKLVKPYNPHSAAGHKLLAELEKGKYFSTDIYACHFTIIDKKEVLLLTDKRIAYISHNDIFGGWQIEWTHIWSEIDGNPTLVPKGVQISVGSAKKGRFKSNDPNKKILLVPNPKVCERIVEEISKYLRMYEKNDITEAGTS